MGTSTGYSAPPAWAELKADVTRAAGAGPLSNESARQILRDHVRGNGGARAMARGASPREGSVGGGRSARTTASRLGGFLADVGTFGFTEALRRAGLADLVGRPINEVLDALVDRLGGPASTIDDADARAALSRLRNELLAEAVDAAEVERILAEQAGDIDGVLRDYFGYYLYEQFCRVFFERLIQRVGEARAHSFLEEIEGFIRSMLENQTFDRDLTLIDWSGREGSELVAGIMETTLGVFGD